MQVLYTTTNAIRAALGLSDKELPDAPIVDLGVEDQLYVRLADTYPTHATLHAAVEAGSATAEQAADYRILKLYVQYEAACCLLPQLQLIVVKKISDGDAEMTRFGPDDLAQLSGWIQGKRDEYLQLINPEFFSQNPLELFGISAPGYDPVTNEGA